MCLRQIKSTPRSVLHKDLNIETIDDLTIAHSKRSTADYLFIPTHSSQIDILLRFRTTQRAAEKLADAVWSPRSRRLI